MSFKESYIDPNGGEKVEIKKLSSVERKKYLKKITKNIVNVLAATMLATSNISAENLDISKLPHYTKNFFDKIGDELKRFGKKIEKHTDVYYSRSDWSDHYDTDYYEKYNTNIKNIENTNLEGITNLNPTGGVLYIDGQKLSLVSAQNVIESERFLKENDLDEVIIRINGTHFKVRPKFLNLSFQSKYGIGKTVTLVYVSYLDKIKVLGTIDKYAGYIEENNPKEYEVLSGVENKKNLYEKISSLLGCSNCRYKKDSSGNVYFYSNGRFVGTLNNMGNEKILTRGNKVLAKIIQSGNNVIMTDSFGNILYKSNGQKILDIKLPTAGERIVLAVKN